MVEGPPKADVTSTSLAAKAKIDALVAKGTFDPKAMRTLRWRTIAKGRFRQLKSIGKLPPQPAWEDDGPGLSSEAIAPMASEAMLGAFCSCLAGGIQANAVARGILI